MLRLVADPAGVLEQGCAPFPYGRLQMARRAIALEDRLPIGLRQLLVAGPVRLAQDRSAAGRD